MTWAQLAKQSAKMATKSVARQQQPNRAEPPAAAVPQVATDVDAQKQGAKPGDEHQPPNQHVRSKILDLVAHLCLRLRHAFGAVELLLAAAIAYFAWIQADIGKGQLRAMLLQNEEMIAQRREMARQGELTAATVEQMKLAQRAFLIPAVDAVELGQRNVNGAHLFDLDLANSGASPAIVDIAGIELLPWGEVLPEAGLRAAIKRVDQKVSAIVPPHGTLKLPMADFVSVPEDWYEGPTDSSPFLYLVARVRYRDAAGEGHDSGFTFLFDRETKRFERHSSGNWIELDREQ